jgi:hypothetical protein
LRRLLRRFIPILPILIATLALLGVQSLRAQSAAGAPAAPVLILPGAASAVALQTHTTDLTLVTSGGALLADGASFYRFRNEGNTDAFVTLRLAALGEAGRAPLPAPITVTAGGQPLTFLPTDGGAEAQVTVPAQGRLDVRVAYTLPLGDTLAPAIRFAASALDEWAGSTSFRLTINVPATIARESWLQVSPEGWRFGPARGDGDTAAASIQWLYEGNLPDEPLFFSFVNPRLWQEIEQRRAVAESGGAPSDYAALGDAYARLSADADSAPIRDRFYGQALAAYSRALDRGATSGATPEQLAPVYAGQARIYRQRTLSPSGAVSPEHARLLVDSVTQALRGLSPADPARNELQQWLNDGLTIVLGDARDRRDWSTALDILDQLQASGAPVDAALIEEERRRIQFEQSLQLLEEGQREAAVAVSGSGLVNRDLAPADAQQSLFASWQSTISVSAGETVLELTALPAPGKELAAADQSSALADALAGAATSIGGAVESSMPTIDAPQAPVRFRITLPPGAGTLALANVIPLHADWALLRTIFSQLAPEVESESSFLRRNELLRLPLDLRAAGEQWRRLNQELEAAAAEFDTQSAPADRSNAASLEAALRARMQAANYRAEANNWAGLVRNSQVVALLEGPRGAPADARAWQITVSDPPQMMQFASWGINMAGLLVLAAALLVGLLILSAFLWSLL